MPTRRLASRLRYGTSVNSRAYRLQLTGVLVLAAALRVGLIDRQGLWVDELFSLAIATGHSLEHASAVADPARGDFVEPPGPVPASWFQRYLKHDQPPAGPAQVVRAVKLSDTNPPLYYLLLNAWTRVTGSGDAALRLFSVAWALACIPLLAATGRRLAGRPGAVSASVLFALSPMAVYYSTEGRMYSMLWCVVLAFVWLSTELRRRPGVATLRVLWIAASVAGLLTHYFFLFVWATVVGFLLVRPGRLQRRYVAIGCLLTTLLVLPWYVQVPHLASAWRITQGWLNIEPGGFNRLKATRDLALGLFTGSAESLWAPRARSSRAALTLFVLVAAAALWRWRLRLFVRERLLIYLWFAAACGGLLLLDALQHTYLVAVPRYAAAALPAGYLLAGIAVAALPRYARAAVVALIALTWSPILVTLYQTNSRNQSPIRQAAALIGSWQPDVVVVHSIPSGVLGIARYVDASTIMTSWVGQLGNRQSPESIRAMTDGRARVVFVRLHDVGAAAPEQEWLFEHLQLVRRTELDTIQIFEFGPRASAGS